MSLAASRRARESLDGLVEGAPFPEELLAPRRPDAARDAVRGRRPPARRSLYLSAPGRPRRLPGAARRVHRCRLARAAHAARAPAGAARDGARSPAPTTTELIEQAARRGRADRRADRRRALPERARDRPRGRLARLDPRAARARRGRRRARRPGASAPGVTLRVDCTASFELPLRAADAARSSPRTWPRTRSATRARARPARSPARDERRRAPPGRRGRRRGRRRGATCRGSSSASTAPTAPARPAARASGSRSSSTSSRRPAGRSRRPRPRRRATVTVRVPGRALIHSPPMRLQLHARSAASSSTCSRRRRRTPSTSRGSLSELFERFPDDGAELIDRIKELEHTGDRPDPRGRRPAQPDVRHAVRPRRHLPPRRARSTTSATTSTRPPTTSARRASPGAAEARAQADVILRAAILLDEAVQRLEGFKDSSGQLIELRALEDEGDSLLPRRRRRALPLRRRPADRHPLEGHPRGPRGGSRRLRERRGRARGDLRQEPVRP